LAKEDDIDQAIIVCIRSDGSTTLHTTTHDRAVIAFEMQREMNKLYDGTY